MDRNAKVMSDTSVGSGPKACATCEMLPSVAAENFVTFLCRAVAVAFDGDRFVWVVTPDIDLYIGCNCLYGDLVIAFCDDLRLMAVGTRWIRSMGSGVSGDVVGSIWVESVCRMGTVVLRTSEHVWLCFGYVDFVNTIPCIVCISVCVSGAITDVSHDVTVTCTLENGLMA